MHLYVCHRYSFPMTFLIRFRSQPSRSNHSYALRMAMLQGQTSPTRIAPTTPNISTLLTLQGTSCCEPTAASFSWGRVSSDQSHNAREAPKRTYSCGKCDIEFAQPQGLSRHRREIHEPKLCIFCGAFKWGRRYLLRKHLKKMHPELDTDLALDEAMGARHGASVVVKALDTSTPPTFCSRTSPIGRSHFEFRALAHKRRKSQAGALRHL
jgi:hypothetical protein